MRNPAPSSAVPPQDRPPLWFWGIPATVALLRALPFLWLKSATPPKGMEFLGLAYIPFDFLSYLSFIRQVGDSASVFFYNAFTTAPQSPRFILLFHWLLGAVSALTGIAPDWVLELSRIPLVFVFFAVLWWFLRPILPDRPERLWACLLIAFSGGIEGFIRPFAGFLPPAMGQILLVDTWDMLGWNTFGSMFNPLWITGLILTLVTFRPVLEPAGTPRPRELFQVGAGIFLTFCVHGYTVVFILGLIACKPVFEQVAGHTMNWGRTIRIGLAAGVSLLLCVAIGHWQSRDEVYRLCSGGLFGNNMASVFWYPITLGVLGVLAIRGFRVWCVHAHPYRYAIAAWILTSTFLHSSPIVAGFKFVYQLHLPLCILAAPVARSLAAEYFGKAGRHRLVSVAVGLLLFATPLNFTVASVLRATRNSVIPADDAGMVRLLSQRSAGNVLAPPTVGNLIPAFTRHRVWVGQWFLTPGYESKAAEYERLVGDPNAYERLDRVLEDQHIAYLVVSGDRAESLARRLGRRVQEQLSQGHWVLFVLTSK